jgi:hypothetical protein
MFSFDCGCRFCFSPCEITVLEHSVSVLKFFLVLFGQTIINFCVKRTKLLARPNTAEDTHKHISFKEYILVAVATYLELIHLISFFQSAYNCFLWCC